MTRIFLTHICFIFLLSFSIHGQSTLELNSQKLTEQLVADLQVKLSAAVYEKFVSTTGQVEQQVLSQWNFNYLLEDYKALGIDPNNPQLVSRLGESLSQVYQRYQEYQAGNHLFTQEEVQNVFSQVWKPAATQVFGKESAALMESSAQLLTQGRDRIQALLQAAEKIHEEPGELPEAEIVRLLRTYGLEGEVMELIEPLEQLTRMGMDQLKDPLEAAQIIRTAMGSNQPVAKIQAMLALGQKFGGRIPIIGDLVTPIFDLGNAVLDATLQLGQSLSQRLNQGCISDAGQYNAQQDARVQSFLKAFPGIHRACPMIDIRLAGKNLPPIYLNTYYNEDNNRELFFFEKGKWIRGKRSPRHNGVADIKGLVQFFRSQGQASLAFDMAYMIDAYNQSPGYTNLRTELYSKSESLGKAYRQIRSQLNLCEERALNDFFREELEFFQLFNLFLDEPKPTWKDLNTRYFWENTLPQQLLFLQYLGKKAYPQLQFAQSPGYEKIDLLLKLRENIDFQVVELFGKVTLDGQPQAGVQIRFEKSAYLYNPYDPCTKRTTDAYGSYRLFYLKYPKEAENLTLEAVGPNGISQDRAARIETQQVYQVDFTLNSPDNNSRVGEESEEETEEEPRCSPGYFWDPNQQECVVDIQEQLQNAPCAQDPHGRALWDNDAQAVVCDCEQGYSWDAQGEVCVSDQEEACQQAFEACSEMAHTTFTYTHEDCSCDCADGYTWNSDKSACIAEVSSPQVSLDCEAYNAVQVINPDTQEPECQCKPGFKPNADGTNCIPDEASPDCVVANASAQWNPQDEVYECHCEVGYQWNADYTACIPEAPDCTQWGPASARWSEIDQVWECVCDAGYYWEEDLQRCVLIPPDCSQFGNAILRYDKFNKEYYCDCATGYKWNRSKTGCIKIDPAANREAAQALGEILTTLSGITRNTSENPTVRPEQQKQGVCNVTYRSGSNEPEQYTIEVGAAAGNVEFSYQTFQVEDRIHIYQGNSKVFDSGCVGTNGWRTQQIRLNGIFGQVRIVVDPLCDPNDPDTRWEFRMGCPN